MGDTHNDENFYRKAREERKGALRFFFAYLRALGALGGGYFQNSYNLRDFQNAELLFPDIRICRPEELLQ